MGLNSGDLKATWGPFWRGAKPQWKAWVEDSAFRVFYSGHRTVGSAPTSVRYRNGARTASPAEDPKGHSTTRSDCASATLGYLGDFTKGPAVFTLYRIGPDQSRYPNGPVEFLIDVDDGVGPRECCRFTDEPGQPVTWNPAWNGDDWCPWILEQANALLGD